MKPAKRMENPYMRFTNYISCELAWTRICHDGVQKGNMANWQVINWQPTGKTYRYGHFNDIKVLMIVVTD